MATMKAAAGLALLLLPWAVHAACPYMSTAHEAGVPTTAHPINAAASASYAAAVAGLDLEAVKQDIKQLLATSQPQWPADELDGRQYYGGLMVRLAWHCSGSYRTWDGRGGCEGARQRFHPELSWPDNTNLDKARALLLPLKLKYGEALSWSDLIILAGTTAIEAMNTPTLGFCAGRVDDPDGSASLALGPTPLQQQVAPCTRGDGNCEQPLGQSVMGLIYVNPGGVMGVPDPTTSPEQIRSTFGRMAMNDSETVALIGGGHAFGKAHGACPTGAGPDPAQSPGNPWPGTCGSGPDKGKGPNTFTSGFEGAWTTHPFQWDNEYFQNLLNYDWVKVTSPGGNPQWEPRHKPGSPRSGDPLPNIMMFTTDVALLHDPEYLKWVKVYAEDMGALDKAFANAWYKLTTRDMGPWARCKGPLVPPPQPWQHPLPPPPHPAPDYGAVKAKLVKALKEQPARMGQYIALAYRCAATFRQTDYQGGCNGARIRLSPQKDWPVNKHLDQYLADLAPVKKAFPRLTWADLIVLAGSTALEQASGVPVEFRGGRSDAPEGVVEEGVEVLAPREYINGPMVAVRDNMLVMGLTHAEGVALAALPRDPAYIRGQGYDGPWSKSAGQTLTVDYFKLLLEADWEATTSTAGKEQYLAKVGEDYAVMTPDDMVLKWDPEFAALAAAYATDPEGLRSAVAAAWSKLMAADLFDQGPAPSALSCSGNSGGGKVGGSVAVA